MTEIIKSKIEEIKKEIPSYVRLIVVSKTVSVDSIRQAYSAGIRDFAENRIQEALIKKEQLQDLTDICWHFIGHLQKNKAKKAIENFDWIHSADSLKITQRLNSLAKEAITNNIIQHRPKICLQVKVLPDPDKFGWEVEELLQNLDVINELDSLQICGLMSILPLGLSEKEILSSFIKVRDLREQINAQNFSHLEIKQLSMGMSGDYLLAIKGGATMIRLGTIIFGKREI